MEGTAIAGQATVTDNGENSQSRNTSYIKRTRHSAKDSQPMRQTFTWE